MMGLSDLPRPLMRWALPRLRYLNLMRAVEGAIFDAHVPDVRGLRVLDAGCGHGYYFMGLALRGAHVVGIDLSPGDVRKGSLLARSLGLSAGSERGAEANACYLAGSITQLPFAGGTFDVVVCNSVLEHIPEDGLSLAEMRRVLRPGGRLVLTVDCDERPLSLGTLNRLPLRWQRNLLKPPVLDNGTIEQGLRHYLAKTYHVVHRYDHDRLARRLHEHGFVLLAGRYYLTRLGAVVYEAFNLFRGLDMAHGIGRGLYVLSSLLLYPFVQWLDGEGMRPGYGLALIARRS